MAVRSLPQGSAAFDLQPKLRLRHQEAPTVFVTGGGTEMRTERPIPRYQMHPQSTGAPLNNGQPSREYANEN
jgi:hypothetical protein